MSTCSMPAKEVVWCLMLKHTALVASSTTLAPTIWWGPARMIDFQVDIRNWSDKNVPLDMEVNPTNYLLWKSKTETFLVSKHPSVGRILKWAERQTEPITEQKEREAANLAPQFDLAQVSEVLFVVLPVTLSDRLRMSRPMLAGPPSCGGCRHARGSHRETEASWPRGQVPQYCMA